MKKLIFVALIIFSAGCASNTVQEVNSVKATEMACVTVSTANKVLTQAIVAHKITKASDLALIQKAKNYTDPICNPDDGVIKPLSELATIEFTKQVSMLNMFKSQVGN